MTVSNKADVAQAVWEHFRDHGFADQLAEEIDRDDLDLEDTIETAWKAGFVQALLGVELGMMEKSSLHGEN